MSRIKGIYLLGPQDFNLIYGPVEQEEIRSLVDIFAPPQTPSSIKYKPQVLADAEVILSGWGMCYVDEAFLNAAPNLRAIFYGAGSGWAVATPAAEARGITVTLAQDANSRPVAEYTLATIIYSLKHAWHLARRTRDQQVFVDRNTAPGCYRRTVGLVSLGMIARKVVELLRPLDLEIIAYDPFVTKTDAEEIGVELVSLEDVFKRSDVVSVHTPEMPETTGMITGDHFEAMKIGASFINTSRGSIVKEDEMVRVLQDRTDLQAVLDVACEEPPQKGSLLYSLDNVFLTPHIAGSVGQECRRMSRYMIEELKRYINGQPLKWQVMPKVPARPKLQITISENLQQTGMLRSGR